MKSMRVCFLLLPLAFVTSARSADVAGVQFYNVRAFGAAGDGKTLDSPAINKAIEACAASGRRDGVSAGRHLLERLDSSEEQHPPAD